MTIKIKNKFDFLCFPLFGRGGRGMMVFLLSVLLLSSCSDRKLIPRKDFISILTEIYLSRSYFSFEGIYNPVWQDSIPYNRHIVERHGYNWAQFDSTVSWYCSRPRRFQEIYETVIRNLNELDRKIYEELDPPSELWAGDTVHFLFGDNGRDSVAANVLLRGVGSYVLSARIRVYPQDESINPRIELYLWRADTTAYGVFDTLWIAPLRRDGLMYEYRFERTLLPGNEFTHLRGNWLHSDRNDVDTLWTKHAEIKDISVYHIPIRF